MRNLLTFARKGVTEQTPVDLNDVAARTALLIVYELQLHGIELEQALNPEAVVVLGDRHELQQVLLNLITNAVQAVSGLPPGRSAPDRYHDRARGRPGRAPRARHRSRRAASQHASSLFTPFFTTKAAGQGTGLGPLAELRSGEGTRRALSYEPPPDGGAEFRVALPLHDAPAEPVEIEAEAAAPHGRRRVLVVDADPGVHRLVNALLSPEGIEVEAVRAGSRACVSPGSGATT